MKEMNENQLRSWQPRRPSAGLKQRLFKLADGPDILPTSRWLWSGFAPTMACALLALMAFNHDGAGLGEKLPMNLILSTQNNAAYATGGAQARENHLAAVTFDWTNRSVFKSSIRFTPATNFSN